MAQSSQPQDVLELGRQLVAELQLEPGVDTLSRWMAHHLAELILEAATESSTKAELQDRAVSTILQVWEHRSQYERTNPFAELEPVIEILRVFAMDTPETGYYLQRGKLRQAAQQVYTLLRILTACFALSESGSLDDLGKALARAKSKGRWLSANESELLLHLTALRDAAAVEAKKSLTDAARSRELGPLDFNQLMLGIVDELDTTLAVVRKLLTATE